MTALSWWLVITGYALLGLLIGRFINLLTRQFPWSYPVIELLSLLLTLLALWFAPRDLTTNDWQTHVSFMLSLCFIWSLLAIAVIDHEHHLIPDHLSLSLLWAGLLVNSSQWQITLLFDAVWGAFLGYTSIWVIVKSHYAITGRIGMGKGDFKLSAAIGAWLGWQSLLPLFIIAGGSALLMMSMLMLLGKHQLQQRFAFGPWLSFAAIILLLLQTSR